MLFVPLLIHGRNWAGSGRSAFSAQGLESCKSADDPLWPSALACLSAKSSRRTGAQTRPGCAAGDPNEDGDSDYCEGSDDRGSSGPNAVFAAALLTSNSTLRATANASITRSLERLDHTPISILQDPLLPQ